MDGGAAHGSPTPGCRRKEPSLPQDVARGSKRMFWSSVCGRWHYGALWGMFEEGPRMRTRYALTRRSRKQKGNWAARGFSSQRSAVQSDRALRLIAGCWLLAVGETAPIPARLGIRVERKRQ